MDDELQVPSCWVRRDGTHPDRHVTIVSVDLKEDTVAYRWSNWIYRSDVFMEVGTEEFLEVYKKQSPAKPPLVKFTKFAARGRFATEFTWRALTFSWNSKRYRYEAPNGWWVSHGRCSYFSWLSGKEKLTVHDEAELTAAENQMTECVCFWHAHSGHGGDGAERPMLEEALEASLEYALRYHHRRIAELRAPSFAGGETGPT